MQMMREGDQKASLNLTDVMRILQFGDSTLPVGGFSFSNGLESAIQQRVVHDVASLRSFVMSAIHQTASLDGIAVIEAHRAASAGDLDRVTFADQTLNNRKVNEEMRLMSARMGRKLAEMGNRVTTTPMLAGWLEAIKHGDCPGSYAIGMGVLFADVRLRAEDAFAVHQYGVASTILGAALRLMRVDHLDTQTIFYEANAKSAELYDPASCKSLDDMATFAPVLDLLASVHVKSHVRMFMN